MCYSRRKERMDRLFNLMSLLEKGEELGQIPSHIVERLREKYNHLIHQTMRLLDQKKNLKKFKAKMIREEIMQFLQNAEAVLCYVVPYFYKEVFFQGILFGNEGDGFHISIDLFFKDLKLEKLREKGSALNESPDSYSREDFLAFFREYFELIEGIQADAQPFRERESPEVFRLLWVSKTFFDMDGPRQKYEVLLQIEKELSFLQNEEEEKILQEMSELVFEFILATRGDWSDDPDG